MINLFLRGPLRRRSSQGRSDFSDYPAQVTVSCLLRSPSTSVQLLFLGMTDSRSSILLLCSVNQWVQTAKGNSVFTFTFSLLGTQQPGDEWTWKHVAMSIKSPNSTLKTPNIPKERSTGWHDRTRCHLSPAKCHDPTTVVRGPREVGFINRAQGKNLGLHWDMTFFFLKKSCKAVPTRPGFLATLWFCLSGEKAPVGGLACSLPTDVSQRSL